MGIDGVKLTKVLTEGFATTNLNRFINALKIKGNRITTRITTYQEIEREVNTGPSLLATSHNKIHGSSVARNTRAVCGYLLSR